MPAVIAFGRRWACGTDDFVFPGIIDSTVKSCWLLSSLIAYFQSDFAAFETKNQLIIYISGLIVSLIVIIIIDVVVINRSAQGTIMHSSSRKMVVPLVYLRLFWEALDTGWNILGTVWMFDDTLSGLKSQDPGTFYFIRRYIICNWVSLIVLALYFAFLYDPLGKYNNDKSDELYKLAREKFWENKIKSYYRLFKSRKQITKNETSFEEIGRILAYILKTTDIISVDAVAGLYPLYRLEEAKLSSIISCSNTFALNDISTIEKHNTNTTTFTVTEDGNQDEPLSSRRPNLDIIEKILRVQDSLDIASKSKRTSCSSDMKLRMTKLLNRLLCCYHLSGSNSEVGDTKEISIIYQSSKNEHYGFTYCIILDHKSKSIIVTIIGVCSASNIAVYLNSWPVRMDIPGLPENFMAHCGMFVVAQHLKENLKVHGNLEKLKEAHLDYKVIITGQNLAAGVSVLLGICLNIEFPELEVICFNPPGGVLSKDGATWTENFTTTIVYGNNLLPTLSILGLRRLKQRVIDVICDCHTPKYKLITGILLGTLGFKMRVQFTHCPQTEGYKNDGYNVTSEDNDVKFTTYPKMTSEHDDINLPEMYLPGKVIHIHSNMAFGKRDSSISENKSQHCGIEYVDAGIFSEINLVPQMLSDLSSFDKITFALKQYQNDFVQTNGKVSENL